MVSRLSNEISSGKYSRREYLIRLSGRWADAFSWHSCLAVFRIDTRLQTGELKILGERAGNFFVLGSRAMSGADPKYLRAAVVLMEELNYSRAASKLNIGQSALSKQIAALQEHLGYALFVREGRKITATPAGEAYAAEAKLSLQHAERAVSLSRAANHNSEMILHVGKSPYTDPYLITILLSLRLPYFPNLSVTVTSKFAVELSHDLLNGTLDLAFLTGIPETSRISSVSVSKQRFFVAMLDQDELSWSTEITAEQLAVRTCILFDRRVQPYLYDDLVERVRPASVSGTSIHHVTTAEEASQFVSRGLGVAILTQAGAWRIAREGITIRPLAVEGLVLETKLACRSDNQARVESEFVRAFVRSLTPSIVVWLCRGRALRSDPLLMTQSWLRGIGNRDPLQWARRAGCRRVSCSCQYS
jgi:DNA-binding transcriptional LysR family regulator